MTSPCGSAAGRCRDHLGMEGVQRLADHALGRQTASVSVYLAEDAKLIRRLLPHEAANQPDDAESLFLGYAVLMRVKGLGCTAADVHDAWAAWMLGRDPLHPALVPFDSLPPDVQRQDLPFVYAIHAAVRVRAGA